MNIIEKGLIIFCCVIIASCLVCKLNLYTLDSLEDYNTVLRSLEENESIFTEKHIINEISQTNQNRRESQNIFSKILDVVKLIGVNNNGEKLYTTSKYQRLEKTVLAKFDKISKKERKNICSADIIENIINQYLYLNSNQKKAINWVCRSRNNINILIGKAGSGKTTTLKAIAEVYKRQGVKVIGMSLASVSAKNLEKVAGIECHSIDYWIYYKWVDKNNHKLNSGDVVIVDECGMIGTHHWKKILHAVEKFDLQLIIVGDCNQLKPIFAGDCLRLFIEQVGCFELSEIIRQKEDWMKKASAEFSKLHTAKALKIYENKQKIHVDKDIFSLAANKYLEFEKTGDSIILCYTKKECEFLNNRIVKIKRSNNNWKSNFVNINNKIFAKNDRVMFLKNNKGYNIQNGQIGTIKRCKGNIIEILVDGQSKRIDLEEYNEIDHAYAITLYKSQGKTFDNVVVVSGLKFDANSSYVAMTRHSKDVALFYSSNDFKSFEDFLAKASKHSYKASLRDFEN